VNEIPRTETQKIQRHRLLDDDTGTIDLHRSPPNA
jgi:hypothetical protein